jgi:hypothetical protein
MPAQAKLDKVLRDLAKENAALLELVAYGTSVSPSEPQFEAEHDKFVANLYDAFSDFGTDADRPFVLTAVISDKHELLMKGTVGKETVSDKRPDGVLLDWLLEICSQKKGPIGNRIDNWMTATGYHEIHIVPYLVAKPWEKVLPADVPARIQDLRKDRELLDDKFIYTAPFKFPLTRNTKAKLPREPYFQSYACVGVSNDWIGEVREKVNIYALLEALMIFYQMSWSNYSIIEEREKKQKEEATAEAKAKEKEAILMFGRIREPIEMLVKQLQAAQQPLNRLQTVLSPVRGLFASNVVPEQLFSSSRQRVEIQGGPYFLQVRHSFREFAEIAEFAGDEVRQINAATEQIAAVVLAGFGELQNAKRPLWEYLRYALHFSDAYRQVASILLEKWPVLQTPSSSLIGQKSRLNELFEGVKYWFNKAGRIDEPMRADFLIAGLNLLFPESSGEHVAKSNIQDSTLFWVPSLLPVQTLSGLEALVREYGNLDSAKLHLEKQGDRDAVSLTLYFSKTAAHALLNSDLKDIQKRCSAFEKRRTDGARPPESPAAEDDGYRDDHFKHTRGNMVFAVMELFGGVPEYDDNDGKGLALSKGNNSMTLTYPTQESESMALRIAWVAQPRKPRDQPG